MKLHLEIKDDKELRDYMKDYLKGLVKTITREDVRELIADELRIKINSLTPRDIRVALMESKNINLHKEVRDKIGSVVDDELITKIESKCIQITSDFTNNISQEIKNELGKLEFSVGSKNEPI